MKIIDWLRWKHHQNASSETPTKQCLRSAAATESAQVKEGKDQHQSTSSQGCIYYRHKGWISHLNPLQLEKRSCGHNKDVHFYEQHTRSETFESGNQAMEKVKDVPFYEQRTRSETCESGNQKVEKTKFKDKNETTAAIKLLSPKQLSSMSTKGPKMETIKMNQIYASDNQFISSCIMKSEHELAKRSGAMLIESDKAQAKLVETPNKQHGPASHLKNRVIPLLESFILSTNSTDAEKLQKVRSVRIFDPIPEMSCEGGYATVVDAGGRSMERAKELLKRSGSVSFEKTATVTKSPESPKSPRDNKWWKLVSSSRDSSKGHSYHIAKWNIRDEVERTVNSNTLFRFRGSMSTMGSPWNSGAGLANSLIRGVHSHHGFCQRHSSSGEGQWITNDSEYVVLEL